MKTYKIVSVLWEDATRFSRAGIPPDNPSEMIVPSLTVGILYKMTKRHVILIQHIDRYMNRDDTDFFAILKPAVLAIEEHGRIPIEGLQHKEGST